MHKEHYMNPNRTLAPHNPHMHLRLPRVALAALLAMSAAVFLPPTRAAQAVPDNISYEGINNPANTTVDLFDYWITGQGDNDHNGESAGYYGNTWVNRGINEDHTLIFHGGASGAHPGDCAADTFTDQIGDYGSPSQVWGPVAQGLVGDTLGEDGYPHLNGQYTYTYNDPFVTINHNDGGTTNHPNNYNGTFNRFNVRDKCSATESLAYLFDPTTGEIIRQGDGTMQAIAGSSDSYVAGKASYPNINGLFSVDKEGYYIYDSGKQTASYNLSSNRIELGDQPSGKVGFWPLDGSRSGVQSQGEHNDYLGMHMQMEFSMPNGGYVLNPQGQYVPMSFTFAGDDDVWVFVDGVLVGDVGGIHQPSSLQIDFQTGQVMVNQNFHGVYNVRNSRGAGNPEYVAPTNLRDLYTNAGMSGATEWNGNTFADGTYHKIDFFYLERGNNESNLVVRFNMINTSDFTAHKALVTANSRPLVHDEFQFELTGYDGVYHRNDTTGAVELVEGAEHTNALMPNGADQYTTPQGAGNGDVSRSFRDDGDKWVYRVGVAADGNVNFGNANYSHSSVGDIFRYKIEEVLPTGATDNGDGTYTYVKDGHTFTCPRPVYYMQAEIKEDEDGNFYLSKRYFVDDQFDIQYESSFASFHNFELTLTPKVPSITATKKLLEGQTEVPLSAVQNQFAFELTSPDGSRIYSRATAGSNGSVTFDLPPITRADFVTRVDGSGKVVFDPLVRTYKIREVIPDGATYNEEDQTYTLNGVQYDMSTYDVTVNATYTYDPSTGGGSLNDPVVTYSSGSAPTFNNILKPVSVSAEKVWDDSAAGSGAPSHPEITFRLYVAEEDDGELVPTETRATHADAEHTTAEDKVIAANATGDDLTVTWDNLPSIDGESNAIKYIVVEGTGTDDDFVAGAPVGYASATTGDQGEGYTITNTLKPLSLRITKKAGPAGQETNPLEGAGFTITRMNVAEEPPVPYEEGDDGFFEQTETTNDSGLATFGGEGHSLVAGTYRISETTVPVGYQKAGDVLIEIAADGTATISGNNVNYEEATRMLSIEITNTELPDLPATGGPGDFLVVFCGVAMIAAALTFTALREGRGLA